VTKAHPTKRLPAIPEMNVSPPFYSPEAKRANILNGITESTGSSSETVTTKENGEEDGEKEEGSHDRVITRKRQPPDPLAPVKSAMR
jgi:hypothetical protein